MRFQVTCFSLLIAFTTQVFARTEIHTTDDFTKIAKEVLALSQGKNAGSRAEDVLVAFDIDKTLLVVQDCLPPGESKGLSGFMKMTNQCPALPTEEKTAASVQSIQKAGFPTIALTARPAALLKATERELKRNGIDFNGHPYDAAADFTVKFEKGAPMIFKEGVTYANGRNKGFILQQFQDQQSRPYKTVVFVDDDMKNIRHMDQTYKADPDTLVIIYHYNRYK